MYKIILGLVVLAICFILYSCRDTNQRQDQKGDTQTISSPDKKVKIEFNLHENGTPTYKVLYNGKTILKPSKLGFTFKHEAPLQHNLQIIDVETNEVNDTWFPVWGDKSEIVNHYKEMIIHLSETNTQTARKMDVVFRVYNDGVGFRYVLPEQEHLNEVEIMSEITEFRLTDNHTTWWIPNDWDSYEYLYQNTPLLQVDEVSTPFTMKTREGIHLVIHEAQLIDYAGMALKKTIEPYTLKAHLAPWPDGVKVKGVVPLKTPWRTIQIGDNGGDLIQSDLIVNLNDPCEIEDTSWIKPMKYVGIWWEIHINKSTWGKGPNHGATTENAKKYIDFAHAYFDTDKEPIGLLVEGWNIGWDGNWIDNGSLFDFTIPYPDFNLEEVVSYAKTHGVEYIMHNETSGDIINYEEQMDDAYDMYERLGIHAIKSGYVADNGMKNPKGMHHHGQYMVNHYYNAVKDAAKHKIMINTHEPIKGTGLYRTYPNWVTREGVQGMEYNAWSEGNPPEHTTILPFTRMLAGSIDYTPGIFNVNIDEQPNNRVHTTRAKQLALYVIISSPFQMVTDLPENYLDNNNQILPEFKFIKDVPVTWDEIKIPQADIGDYVSIVRRKDEEWYIGSITDENARDLEIPLDFLDEDQKYVAEIYSDSSNVNWETNPNGVSIHKLIVDKDDTFIASLAEGGGQAVRLYKASESDINTLDTYMQPGIKIEYNHVPLEIESNDAFEVSVSVTNNGSVIASQKIDLYLDGTIVDTKVIRIDPFNTKEIKFVNETLFHTGTYKIKINQLVEKNITVREKEPTFIYNQLEVNQLGNIIYASAKVSNLGTHAGVVKVGLYINGDLIEEKEVMIDSQSGGVSKEVSFTYNIPTDGVYEVTIGDLDPKILSYPNIDMNTWLFKKGDNMDYKERDYNDGNWQVVTLPSSWEEHSNYYEDNVFGWYRKSIYIPKEWEGYSLKLTLGKIDDADQTFFNGYLVGESGVIPDGEKQMETAWETVRVYIVPNEYIQYGALNVISIRVYDATVGGGLYEGPLKDIELVRSNNQVALIQDKRN